MVSNFKWLLSEILHLHSKLSSPSSDLLHTSFIDSSDITTDTHHPDIKLQISDLTYSYTTKSIPLYSGLSHSFQSGFLNLIQGASGTGKSTLLDVLLGLRPPTHGTVTYNDVNIYSHDSLLKLFQSKIYFVPQTPSLIDGSLYENLLFPLYSPNCSFPNLNEDYVFDLFNLLTPFVGHSLSNTFLELRVYS